LANTFLVTAQGQAFVETAVELALEFADGPVLPGGFDFVEATFVSVLDAKEKDIMRPAQGKEAR
jgi:hypothetical protein